MPIVASGIPRCHPCVSVQHTTRPGSFRENNRIRGPRDSDDRHLPCGKGGIRRRCRPSPSSPPPRGYDRSSYFSSPYSSYHHYCVAVIIATVLYTVSKNFLSLVVRYSIIIIIITTRSLCCNRKFIPIKPITKYIKEIFLLSVIVKRMIPEKKERRKMHKFIIELLSVVSIFSCHHCRRNNKQEIYRFVVF